nr:TetR/AcrR family transcriptional regulator [Leucobacter weissii]
MLDLAEILLERDGLERFGVNALAREADLKPPSLYKHFTGAEDLEHALISRCFLRLAERFDTAETATASAGASARERVSAFAAAYRDEARRAPQLYRLATGRPLDRSRIEPGAEEAAMGALLRLLGESGAQRDRARFAWAAAHGLTALELAERFPPEADLDAAWALFVDTVASLSP